MVEFISPAPTVFQATALVVNFISPALAESLIASASCGVFLTCVVFHAPTAVECANLPARVRAEVGGMCTRARRNGCLQISCRVTRRMRSIRRETRIESG